MFAHVAELCLCATILAFDLTIRMFADFLCTRYLIPAMDVFLVTLFAVPVTHTDCLCILFVGLPSFFWQLARVADRVRRMPLHSPLAAVLAGVELTLRKAQDWEQHAHRGVSLKDELRSLSALVVRWRAVELKSWPQLLDAREDAFVLKV